MRGVVVVGFANEGLRQSVPGALVVAMAAGLVVEWAGRRVVAWVVEWVAVWVAAGDLCD